MVTWLWIGGALTFGGTFLAAFPGQKRRLPTQPTSEVTASGQGPRPDTTDPALIGADV